MKPNIVILSGAGISRENGIQTFRDANGLWRRYDITKVASPEAWQQHPDLVLDFYNQRRRQLQQVRPNAAHKAITKLQKYFPVQVLTQNVDDLHERAGNKNVWHLHGELLKVRSEKNKNLIYPWHKDLKLGDLAADGAQLRPHIVWFGEAVPMLEKVLPLVNQADIFILIGTSMQVYPAAGLVHQVQPETQIYYIDPKASRLPLSNPLKVIPEKAGRALPALVDSLIYQYCN